MNEENTSLPSIATKAELSNELVEILPALIVGHSIPEIADRAGITNEGVAKRSTKIYKAFGVKGRRQLVQLAATNGLHFICPERGSGCFALTISVVHL